MSKLYFLLLLNFVTCQNFQDLKPANNYSDYDVPESNSTLNRCFCSDIEVYVNGKCQRDERLLTEVLNSEILMGVKDIACGGGSVPVKLPEKSYEIQYNGKVFINEMEIYVDPDSYCTERTLDEQNEIVSFIKICLFPPEIVQCCHSTQYPELENLSKTSTGIQTLRCAYYQSYTKKEINVGVFIDQTLVSWNSTHSTIRSIACPIADYKIISVPISSELSESYISYGEHRLILNWISEIGRRSDNSFCLDGDGSKNINAYVCHKDPFDEHEKLCAGQNCVRKCCKKSEVYIDEYGCEEEEVEQNWLPNIDGDYENSTDEIYSSFRTVYGMPLCKEYSRIDSSQQYTLLESGNLNVQNHPNSYSSVDYCLDNLMDDTNITSRVAFLCVPKTSEEPSCNIENLNLQLALLFICCLMLFVNLLVYCSVKKIFQTLLNKVIASQTLALLITCICLIILHLKEPTTGDSATGIILYYSRLASFLWFSLMCFEIYWNIKHGSDCGHSRVKLLSFLSFGWGIPLLFIIKATLIDTDNDYPLNNYNLYAGGTDDLDVSRRVLMLRWAYMYGPALFLLTVDFILILSIITMQRKKKDLLYSSDGQNCNEGKKINKIDLGQSIENTKLCVYFFVIMLVTFIFDMILSSMGQLCSLPVWTDAPRSIIIFLIFALKKQNIFKEFKKSWQKKLKRKGILRTNKRYEPSDTVQESQQMETFREKPDE